MPWKMPDRPSRAISQPFNDGYVDICTVTDAAKPGYQPQEAPTPRLRLNYEERRLGVHRYYNARQNQLEIERVLRVPRVLTDPVTSQDLAITEDGRKYRIDMVQLVPDVYPPCNDLSLVAYRQEAKT